MSISNNLSDQLASLKSQTSLNAPINDGAYRDCKGEGDDCELAELIVVVLKVHLRSP